MVSGFSSVFRAFYLIYSRVTVTLVANLIMAALSVPVIAVLLAAAFASRTIVVIPLGAAVLLGVLPAPTGIPVQVVARDLARGDLVFIETAWKAFRDYWRLCLPMWLGALALTVVLVANVLFYGHLAQTGPSSFRPAAFPLELIWLAVLLFWISVHLYVFPLLLEQEVKRPLTIYRNATLMALGRPLATWIVVPIWLLILLLTSGTGLALIFGFTLAALLQHCVFQRVFPTFAVE